MSRFKLIATGVVVEVADESDDLLANSGAYKKVRGGSHRSEQQSTGRSPNTNSVPTQRPSQQNDR